MRLTIFGSKKTLSKRPVSPFEDKTFIFETRDVASIRDIYDFLTSSFVLNVPLQKSLRARKLRKTLEEYFVKELDYLIIDIDKIKTETNKELALKFFRDN